ncbi:1,2-phenylacetyl-CoA epoxidase subunit PaaC [Pollutibacter soli]|uniref:1,2-phenylacetyl-CoA epoxidase subunit PaaC n=1 Tax=Pollutibacter soli TaxID=3034157 RepID=UPI0030140518
MDHLHNYLLHLADNALILGHRNSEWCGHGPVLEQDIALTNISLDLLGQARYFYQYAASRAGAGVTEDSLAYLRDTREFKNFLVLELPDSDWGFTVLRQYLFSQYQYLLYEKLVDASDQEIAAIAEKSLKEVAYHVRWSKEWVIRLGDGTTESRKKMIASWNILKDYVGEFFIASDEEKMLTESNMAVDPVTLREKWISLVNPVFEEATLEFRLQKWTQQGGRQGMHTEHLGYLLAEMQYMQRTYPGMEW